MAMPGLSVYRYNDIPWFPLPDNDNPFPPIDSYALNNLLLSTDYISKHLEPIRIKEMLKMGADIAHFSQFVTRKTSIQKKTKKG